MSENILKGLKPELLWQRFFEITQVPRPSKKEEKILAYLKNLCEELKLTYKEDKVGSLVISIPATKGYEKAPVVVLQAHVDMVCEKNKGTEHDFDNDPLKLKIVDGWVAAEGTTLGSDNGIGMAAALAIITDKDSVHGPLEVLLTVDEETGLTGASNLESGFITGKTLLNLDSEEDGAFYVGCSGGIDTAGIFNIQYEEHPKDCKCYELTITGLKGGHSGLDIHTGRGNAIKLLARTLYAFDFKYHLSKIEGGSKRNAIPREAEAYFCINSADEKKLTAIVTKMNEDFKNEFNTADGNVLVKVAPTDCCYQKTYAPQFTEKFIKTLLALPHGVFQMSQDIEGLVETSTNLATIVVEGDKIVVGSSQRSSIESAKRYAANSVKSVFELAGAEVKTGDGYPGWKPNLDSPILHFAKDVYKKLYGKEPEIKAIHAGLECGILGDKEPGLDMISFGPTITGAHSPDEKVNIETVDKFYTLLKGILKEIAEKA